MARRYSPARRLSTGRCHAGWSEHAMHRHAPVYTAAVTRPGPDSAYLDEALDGRARARLRAPRRRLPPRDRGAGEHPGGVPARRRRSATATSRPTSTPPATACCWPSTTRCSTGSPTAAARSRTLTLRRGRGGADRRPRAGPDAGRALRRVPGRPLQHRPQVRRPRCRCWPSSSTSARRWDRVLVGSFSPRRLDQFRRLTGGRVADLGPPARGGRVPLPAQRPAGRPAHPRAGSPRCRSRTGAGRLTVATPGLVRRAHAAGKHVHVVDHRRPRRDARAARPWCRRADDRPHRHTQGRARRARAVEGATA